MATSQQFLVCSNSSAANFKAWASVVSNWLRTCGWTNTSDTGQLNGAGANNWAGVSTVPGSGVFYYEIFQPGDGLAAFFLKLEYGNVSGQTNSPTLAITLGTATDGAGNLVGALTSRQVLMSQNTSSPSATTIFECNFSGDSGRVAIMLWRNASTTNQQLFAVQRSLNASGAATSAYATMWGVGNANANPNSFQQSLHLTNGAGPLFAAGNTGIGWNLFAAQNALSLAFAGQLPMWNASPAVGIFDYPCTVVGGAMGVDMAEGVPFTIVNQYGQTKTYMPSKTGAFTRAIGGGTAMAICMEYD